MVRYTRPLLVTCYQGNKLVYATDIAFWWNIGVWDISSTFHRGGGIDRIASAM